MTDVVPRNVKLCRDFTGAPDCCDSCHDDYDMGFDMVEEYGERGEVVAIVCCRVSNWLDKHAPKPRYD